MIILQNNRVNITQDEGRSVQYRARQIGDLQPSYIQNIPLERSSYWRVLQSRMIADCSPYMQVMEETIALPDGRVIDDYHRLNMPDHVVIYPRTRDGMVAILRQYKHGLGEVTMTLPGGMVDEDESPERAAVRELSEETGLISTKWYPLGSYCVNGNYGAGMGHYYLADDCYLGEATDSDDIEEAEMLWFEANQLQRMLNMGGIPLMHHALAVALVKSFESDP